MAVLLVGAACSHDVAPSDLHSAMKVAIPATIHGGVAKKLWLPKRRTDEAIIGIYGCPRGEPMKLSESIAAPNKLLTDY
jgi:hypothetical protein